MKPAARRSVVRTLLLAMLGTGLAMGLAFPPVVHPFAVYKPGLRLAFTAICVAAGLAVGGLNFLLVRRFLLRPVERVGAQLRALSQGEGYLTSHVALDSDDALGRLVENFNQLLARLQESLQRIVDSVEASSLFSDRTSQIARSVNADAEQVARLVEEAGGNVGTLAAQFRTMAEAVTTLHESALENQEAVETQLAQNRGAGEQIAELLRQARATAEGLAGTARAVERTGSSAQDLTRALDEAAASMTQMDGSIREIERNLDFSATAAEQVAADSGLGAEAVQRSQDAMDRIRTSMEAAAAAIRSLSGQVQQIGAVTVVIGEVTDQTSLLALNAAIIAAQAGENGRGFAVVAGQIKKLAERTHASTREIGERIASFQEQARAALDSMTQTQQHVLEGVERAGRAGEALGRIQGSASASHLHVQGIGRSAQEIAATSHYLARTVESIATKARDISTATREQEGILRTFETAAEQTRRVADSLTAAADSQLSATRRVQSQVETLGTLIASTGEAIERGYGETLQLRESFRGISALARREQEAIRRCAQDGDELAAQTRTLREEVSRLRPAGEAPPATDTTGPPPQGPAPRRREPRG